MPSLDLIALAVGGTDWGTWLRQQSYSIAGVPHIEFTDIDDFVFKVRKVTGFSRPLPSPHLPSAHPPPSHPSAHPKHGAKNAPLEDPFQPMRRLTVLSHGEFDGPVMGSGHGDVLNRRRVLGRKELLSSMRHCFAPDAEVVFGGCNIGQNPWLLSDLSQLWNGIPVTAFTTIQKLGSPFYMGEQVTVRGYSLIAGRNTPGGQQFLAHPFVSPGAPDFTMGN